MNRKFIGLLLTSISGLFLVLAPAAAAPVIVTNNYMDGENTNCSAQYTTCTLSFAKVPAAKTLNVAYVSCYIQGFQSARLQSLYVQGTPTPNYSWLHPNLINTNATDKSVIYQSTDSIMHVFVAGQTPKVVVEWDRVAATTLRCTIAGYIY